MQENPHRIFPGISGFACAVDFIYDPDFSISVTRLLAVAQMLNLAMVMIPVDFVFAGLMQFMPEFILKLAGLAGVAGICAAVIMTGNYHGFLFYILTRYNSTVEVTKSITEDFPYQKYTIISTTDDLYQIVPYGWHEELVLFINSSSEPGYTIPSQYVIIYLEKHPIFRSQYHFFSGPSWLGVERYAIGTTSVGDEVIMGEIREDYIAPPGSQFTINSYVYAQLGARAILESTMYDWCQKFEELYPNELKVYYEDDDIICYYFKQNINRLYELGIR